jgi:uncharacterized protein
LASRAYLCCGVFKVDPPKLLVAACLLGLGVCGGFGVLTVKDNISPVKADVSLLAPYGFAPGLVQASVELAIISDLHIADTSNSYRDLEKLVQDVLISEPDFILLLGDYTASPDSVADLVEHRRQVASILGELSKIPSLAVLGNYESWSEPSLWAHELVEAGLIVLQNEVLKIPLADQDVCFRGLGDAFTDQLRFIEFTDKCQGLLKITLTHDPAGAFYPGVGGIVFAGHTHCGQVKLPLIGSLWIPSDAPVDATCGLYKDDERTLWVSSGTGTSILPIRFGAQAEWDFVTLQPEETVYKSERQ